MKILTVIGARPQFIKAAALSRVLRCSNHEVLVHTGQHYDANMSDIFFSELGIPSPDYNLGISGGSHAAMTGKMLIAIEEVLLQERPEAVLLYGDTNSTLAGALAAVKLSIPIIHVEAGNRLGTLNNPEEANRIATDHLSTLLFCASESAMNFLKNEGLENRSFLSGNIMYDAFLHFSKKANQAAKNLSDYNDNIINMPDKYCYMTCHRAENTSDDATLTEIFKAVDRLPFPTIYPVHPRSCERARRLKQLFGFPKLILIPPVGYLESIRLTQHANLIITDSGGLQCEAFYAEVPCITVFDHVVWPETLVGNRNQMAKPNADDIYAKTMNAQIIDRSYMPFGDSHAADKIVSVINRKFGTLNQ